MLEHQAILVQEVTQEILEVMAILVILVMTEILVMTVLTAILVMTAILVVVVLLVHLAILVNLVLLVVTGVNQILAVVLLVVLWQGLNIPSSLMEVTLE
tara:strand:+ start:400 stop:696 length:297 start_codon:yes stop_codon:yes gene_type:complete